MKKNTLTALLFAATVAAPAFGGDTYVVGGIGRSTSDLSKGQFDSAVTSVGAAITSSSLRRNGTAYKAQAGYQFNPNIAIEGGYVDLGKAAYSANFAGGSANIDVKTTGLNIAAVGTHPINDTFSAFGKLGLMNAKTATSLTGGGGGGGNSVASTRKTNFNWGFGGAYTISKQLDVRVEYEKFYTDTVKIPTTTVTIGKAGVSLLSTDFVYKF
jgi:OOP family OmpA-OmpF porin